MLKTRAGSCSVDAAVSEKAGLHAEVSLQYLCLEGTDHILLILILILIQRTLCSFPLQLV